MYDYFIAECKKEMRLRKLKNGDLARLTGFKTSTIDAFFSVIAGRERSEKVAKAISAALGVEL